MSNPSGTSALVAVVPGAEPAIAAWRNQFDPSAAVGMPAHITIVYPFLHESELTATTIEEIQAVCQARTPITVTFDRTARFPNLLYLAPEPPDPIIALTDDIAKRWPHARPYGGAFDSVIPHATIAHGNDDLLDAIDADVAPHLPIRTTVSELVLFVFDGQRWHITERFPLGSTKV